MTEIPPKSTQEFLNSLKTGLVFFDLEDRVVFINNSAKKLLNFESIDNWGDYTESLQELLTLNEPGYHKQLTGILGKPLNATLHLQDEQKIIELSESYETKLGEASHELRRPLSNIKTLVDTLYLWGAGEDPEARKKFLGQLHEQTDRLVNTINELLSLSRMQAGSININAQQIALHNLVSETIELLLEQASESEVELINQIPEDYVLIADLDKVHHVVQNLIENAIRYNRKGGSVTIRPGEIANSFEVADTGIGIKEEDQPKVFERFKRIHKEVPGTGLGLAIVKTIVDLHGGKIDLESEYEKGTTFKVTLPEKELVKMPS